MIAGHIFNYGSVLSVEELSAKLEAVDAAAVRRYGARTMTATQPPAIVTVGPASKLESYEIFAGRFGSRQIVRAAE
jgi:predicted Zn-dependent peptidase